MDEEQKTLVTEDGLDRAVREARQQGEMMARIEVGEWIEANMLNGPRDNPYTAIFPVLVKLLKQGKKL
ncbi:hypothetical protein ACFLYR_05285 [Chloroflexota bacterium]